MGTLVALDPSITSSGLAVFVDGRLLVTHCVKSSVKSDLDIMARVGGMVESVLDLLPFIVDELVCEWPQAYTATKSKSSAKSIIPLAGVCCGVVVALCRQHPDMKVRSYLPAEWAGQLPKATTVKDAKRSPRAIRIQSRLTEAELQVYTESKYHDEIDAIGIGLHHLGRLGRRRAV